MLFPIVAGAALGGLFVLLAHRRSSAGEVRLLAIGLVVAAIIYVGLALARAGGGWLAVEAVGLAVFAGLAWLGVRSSLWWLALGWAAHVAWDVGLHLDREQPVIGAWYPLWCTGFDLVVAGFLVGAALTRRASPAPAV